MKKLLALTLTGLLVLGGSGFAVATAETSPVRPDLQADITSSEKSNIYLVPGTYTENGTVAENVISSGATKLTESECGEIFTDNAYICNLSAGDKLPVPQSTRKDKDGNSYSFNGWWTIVDATVTYFDTVPDTEETTFLYADWRADLSQRKDPVITDESTAVQPEYYMSILRKETQKTEIVRLYVSGTDASSALQFGYGAPVQFYNDWFELSEGDEITVYTKGLGGSEKPCVSPIEVNGKCEITFDKSATENNDTADYLERTGDTTVTYTASETKHFRIYVKFYDEGATMTVYMQPKE